MERKPEPWSEWQIVQLQECFMNGIAPEETTGLLGKTKDEVFAKAHELDLLFPSALEESPPVAPELSNILPRRIDAG